MPILNRVSEMHDEIVAWRRDLHRHPEIGFELERTAGLIAGRLEAFGCDAVHRGIGRSGVVALIRGNRGAGPTIGLRSDMDALPIREAGNRPHASLHDGAMHACGHDGHAAMLLGAAKYLAETRNFAGTVALIFQPAEETGAGALAMIEDGLFERFAISHVYGMHNMPGLAVGDIALRAGAIMAASARFTIRIGGRGGHAAHPHESADPIVAGCRLVEALQTIVSRGTDPVSSAVVTVTRFDAGTAFNVIPDAAELWGSVRALSMDGSQAARDAVHATAQHVGAACGVTVDIDYHQTMTVTRNDPAEALLCAQVAREMLGAARVDDAARPVMAGEDFSRMLEKRPGTLVFLGNGASAGLHHPAYDFEDEAIPSGVSYWVRLVERRLAP